MITGGTEAAITQMGLAGFQNMQALSTRNDDPQRASRPFDAIATASCSAKGPACSCSKNWSTPRRAERGFIAEMLGFGASADGGHITQPDEEGTGAAGHERCAGRRPAESGRHRLHQRPRHQHAAGRQGRDAGHQDVFGEHAKKVSISSTKSQLGHLLGASGGVELVRHRQSPARTGVIPPTINLDQSRSRIAIWITRPTQPASARLSSR